MGTDIFCCVERCADSQWLYVGPPIVETREDWRALDASLRESYPGVIVESNDEKLDALRPWAERLFIGRNYPLFAILAGVRNDMGLFLPIADPRGVPDDASRETLWSVARNLGYEDDAHDHSWVTLGELLAYDWERGVSSERVGGSSDAVRSVSLLESTTANDSTCRAYVGERFSDTTLPFLRQFGDPGLVRLVFFFDS